MVWYLLICLLVGLNFNGECKLFIGDCTFGYCEQSCNRVGRDFMKCECKLGYILQNDGRKCKQVDADTVHSSNKKDPTDIDDIIGSGDATNDNEDKSHERNIYTVESSSNGTDSKDKKIHYKVMTTNCDDEDGNCEEVTLQGGSGSGEGSGEEPDNEGSGEEVTEMTIIIEEHIMSSSSNKNLSLEITKMEDIYIPKSSEIMKTSNVGTFIVKATDISSAVAPIALSASLIDVSSSSSRSSSADDLNTNIRKSIIPSSTTLDGLIFSSLVLNSNLIDVSSSSSRLSSADDLNSNIMKLVKTSTLVAEFASSYNTVTEEKSTRTLIDSSIIQNINDIDFSSTPNADLSSTLSPEITEMVDKSIESSKSSLFQNIQDLKATTSYAILRSSIKREIFLKEDTLDKNIDLTTKIQSSQYQRRSKETSNLKTYHLENIVELDIKPTSVYKKDHVINTKNFAKIIRTAVSTSMKEIHLKTLVKEVEKNDDIKKDNITELDDNITDLDNTIAELDKNSKGSDKNVTAIDNNITDLSNDVNDDKHVVKIEINVNHVEPNSVTTQTSSILTNKIIVINNQSSGTLTLKYSFLNLLVVCICSSLVFSF